MYCFVNDISISPKGIVVQNSRPILKSFLNSVYTLHQYGIEKTRVPENFESLSIAGSFSISELYITATEVDEKNLIISFLGNRIENIPSSNADYIQQEQSKGLFDIYFDGASSELLKEAYVMNLPAVSFNTKPIFAVTTLHCKKYILNEQGDQFTPKQVHNIYSIECHITLSDYLLQVNHEIIFAAKRFNPANDPCWRGSKTIEILEKYSYPDCLRGLGMDERRAINMEIAPKILDANGWDFSQAITGLNKDRPEVWKIYTNRFSDDNFYISVDLGEGEFEIQDRKGKWVRTVFFDGRETGKDYSKQKNSKNKEGHHINIK